MPLPSDAREARPAVDREPSGIPCPVLVATVCLDCVAILPAGLVGVLALSISSDVGTAATHVGLGVSAYFLAGSLAAGLLGSHIDRIGPRRAATLSGLLSACCLGVVALPLDSVWLIGLACIVGGPAMAITMPSTNAVLGALVPVRNRMLVVCAKQAAVPIALAGAAATIAVVDGPGAWHVVFLYASVLGLAAIGGFRWVTRHLPDHVTPHRAAGTDGRAAQRAVLRVGVSSMLASLLAGTLTGYAAISLDDAQVSPYAAAAVLAVSNTVGIIARLATGWVAQRRGSRNLRIVAAMMIAGGLGAGLMSVGSPVAVSIGCVVAFGLGWGWSALTYAVVLELNLDHPGATGSVIQAGGMAGSGTGPLIMAGLVGTFGLTAGWLVVGCAALAAGALLWGYEQAA